MENSFISPIDYDLNIPKNFNIKTAIIRGGRLWGILNSQNKNRILFFANLLVKPRPFVKIFEDINSFLFIYVSNDGQFCLVRKTENVFCLSASDFQPFEITLPPDVQICCATFFKDELFPQPFIFIAIINCKRYQIGLIDLNKKFDRYKFVFLPFQIADNKSLKDISVSKFKDGYYCFSIIYLDRIVPYIVDKDFLQNDSSTTSYCTQIGLINHIYTENNYIGWVPQLSDSKNQLAFEYIIDQYQDHSRPDKIYSCQYAYSLPSGKTCGICFFSEFFLHFQENGRINIFINNAADSIDGFVVKDANLFEFDIDEGELYAIYPHKITNIKFECSAKNNFRGIDSLRYWLYCRSIARKDEEVAAKLICNMKSLSFNDIFLHVRQTTTLRFYVYKHILKTLRKQKPPKSQSPNNQSQITKQKVALAYATFDLYTRIEMAKKKPDLIKYTEFTKDLIKEGLLNMETVKKTLDEYGFDSPYIRLSEPLLVFDRLMERNEKDKALQILPRISNKDKKFSNALLRVFPYSKATVVDIISKFDSFDSGNFVPILMDKKSLSIVTKILSRNCKLNPWLTKLFTIITAREDRLRKRDVEQLFTQFQFTNIDIVQFIMRELKSLGKFTFLTYGFISIKQYVIASAFAVKSPDCLRLIDVIFSINTNRKQSSSTFPIADLNGTVDLSQHTDCEMDTETKMRCIYTILRSVTPEKAAELAQKLIYRLSYDQSNTNLNSDKNYENDGTYGQEKGVDSTILMLMNFLPFNTELGELTDPINEFTKQKKKETEEQEKNKNEALSEIVKVSALLKDQPKDENTIVLHSVEVCEKCRKPFFSEPGIIYPCSHMLHVRCAKEMIMGIEGIENDVDLDFNDDYSESFEDDEPSRKLPQMVKKVQINLPARKNSKIKPPSTVTTAIKSKKEKKKTINYKSDCPLCGYLSVRLMNEPFRGHQAKTCIHVSDDKKYIDPFTTDISQLTALVNSGKKTTFFNI